MTITAETRHRLYEAAIAKRQAVVDQMKRQQATAIAEGRQKDAQRYDHGIQSMEAFIARQRARQAEGVE